MQFHSHLSLSSIAHPNTQRSGMSNINDMSVISISSTDDTDQSIVIISSDDDEQALPAGAPATEDRATEAQAIEDQDTSLATTISNMSLAEDQHDEDQGNSLLTTALEALDTSVMSDTGFVFTEDSDLSGLGMTSDRLGFDVCDMLDGVTEHALDNASTFGMMDEAGRESFGMMAEADMSIVESEGVESLDNFLVASATVAATYGEVVAANANMRKCLVNDSVDSMIVSPTHSLAL
jgi:hypothetical protein